MSAALPHLPKLLASVPAPAARPVALRLDGVSKRHGAGEDAVIALDTMSLSVRAGEFVCIVGASGCGKSTMLNLVAGLDTPSAGQVHVEGGRPALMFQESALFPWLTVEENVAFPLQMQGVGRGERKQRVAELLAMVRRLRPKRSAEIDAVERLLSSTAGATPAKVAAPSVKGTPARPTHPIRRACC